jgi:two-component system, cell cycle sensor histidine kinase and response regulator CckA
MNPADSLDAVDEPVVLVVDDDRLVRDMTTTILHGNGFLVLAAGDGKEGLEVSRSYRGRIDLVITDLEMPQIDGAEFLTQVLEERPAVKAIVRSGSEVRSLLRAFPRVSLR